MNDQEKSDAMLSAVAVARHVKTLLPPLKDIDAIWAVTEMGQGLGPEMTVPAVYLHIIISAFEAEVLAHQRKAMEDVLLKPQTSMDDEQITELAIHLANEAHNRSFEAREAAMALWKGAASIAIANMPHATVLAALDGIHAITRADVADVIGAGATRQ
ncbi:MAG: hypothetical protein DI547_16685 [Sphingobium sp.]|nr:MAG: hypothetical protein DI547_16685 [Sphingobium sp.]